MNRTYSFWRCDRANETDVTGSVGLGNLQARQGRSASGKHRLEDHHGRGIYRRRQFSVITAGDCGVFIAFKSHEPNACVREHVRGGI